MRSVLTTLLLIAIISLIGCVGAATPAPTPTSQQALDMTPAKIRFGLPTGIALPTFIVAQDQGFFARENLTVEESQVNGSALINDALTTGNLDMGQSTPSTGSLAILKGAKMIMVSGFENTFTDKSGNHWETSYVVVRSGEGIQKIADLKGKKVAVNSIAGAGNYMLRANLLTNHIDPDKDVTIVPIATQQMPGALMQKLVDAVILTADGYVQTRNAGKVDLISTQTSMMNLDMDLSATLAVNKDFLQKQPDVVVRFLRAFIQARQWMADDVSRNDGKTLQALVAKAMSYSPERAKSFYETRGGYYGKELDTVNLLDIPTRVITRNYEILQANGLIKSDTPNEYQQIVDLRPLKRAYDSLDLKWDDSKH
jgi:NitT/TauT family transport system substrate-binding protein